MDDVENQRGEIVRQGAHRITSMAMLGSGGVADAIVKGVLKRVLADERVIVDQLLRNVVIEELVHGSSLICRNEGEGYVNRLYRLVQEFILRGIESRSAW